MIRKLNRLLQNYMREKRLKIGKYIWDRKEKKEYKVGNNFIEDNAIKSIIFLRYDGKIGDMIINTLMFREIKKFYPYIKIGVVARGNAKDIIKENPYVDKIYDYEKNRKKIKRLAEKIRNENYDLLIDFSEVLRVNEMMLINLAKAKFNMGLDRENWNLFDLNVRSKVDFSWKDHITERYKSYLVKLGVNEKEIETSYDIFYKKNEEYDMFLSELKNHKILLLNPFGSSKHKSFSLKMLNKIIKFLDTIGVKVILLHYEDKYKEIKDLEIENKNLYIPKKISSIENSIYLIANADYVITPDTSVVHIASALNKKSISVYPPNGGKLGVDHLVWAPKSKNIKVIFCKDKNTKYDEIDINTFNFEEMKKEIIKMIKE